MATISKALARQAFPLEIDDVYITPIDGSTAIVTNIVVVNTAPIQHTFTMNLDGVELFADTAIAGNSTISIDLKQVIIGNINAFASSSLVKLHISGIEIV